MAEDIVEEAVHLVAAGKQSEQKERKGWDGTPFKTILQVPTFSSWTSPSNGPFNYTLNTS